MSKANPRNNKNSSFRIVKVNHHKFFEYKDELFRDPRMYVINLTKATVEGSDGEKEKKWTIVTYKNTTNLPYIRHDIFDSKEEAIDYLKDIEPVTPLVTIDGKPRDYPSNDRDQVWGMWCYFLIDARCLSAITEYQNYPYHVFPSGGSFTHKEYYTVKTVRGLQ